MKDTELIRNINPFGLRLQPDLKSKVEEAAAKNHRSLNAEITARLETTFELDELMAEMRAGDHRGVADMLQSVWADNDRMTASGEQTFSTAHEMLESLLDKKLAPLVELLKKQ